MNNQNSNQHKKEQLKFTFSLANEIFNVDSDDQDGWTN